MNRCVFDTVDILCW